MGRTRRTVSNREKNILTRRFALLLLIATAVVLASLATSHPHSGPIAARKGDLASSSTVSGSNSLAISDPDSLPSARRLYPYSVIPGGVQSAGELGSAVRNDAVVARHYADFDVAKAHVISLERDRLVYVSYRMGEEIFWTNRALQLHKGETLITDGTHEARTRCGNRIADTAQAPSSAQQPALDAFEGFAPMGELEASNLPIDGELAPTAPFSTGHPLALEQSDFARPFYPFAPGAAFGPGLGSFNSGGTGSSTGTGSFLNTGGSTGSGSSSDSGSPEGTPVATPEPSTMLLLSAGLGVWFVTEKFRRRVRNRS
jgi:uncharacterized membrane protein YgcG